MSCKSIKDIIVDGMSVNRGDLMEAAIAFREEFKFFNGPRKIQEAVRILRDNGCEVEIIYKE